MKKDIHRNTFWKKLRLEIDADASCSYLDLPRWRAAVNISINLSVPLFGSLFATTFYHWGNLSLPAFIILQVIFVIFESRSLATILRARLICRERIHTQGFEEFRRQNRRETYALLMWSAVGFGVVAVVEGSILGAKLNVLVIAGLIVVLVAMVFDFKRMEWS